MRNFPQTGEQVINTKKNSPLRRGVSQVERTIFIGIDHLFTCLREISHKIVRLIFIISVIYSHQTGHCSISVPTGSFSRIIYAQEDYIFTNQNFTLQAEHLKIKIKIFWILDEQVDGTGGVILIKQAKLILVVTLNILVGKKTFRKCSEK